METGEMSLFSMDGGTLAKGSSCCNRGKRGGPRAWTKNLADEEAGRHPRARTRARAREGLDSHDRRKRHPLEAESPPRRPSHCYSAEFIARFPLLAVQARFSADALETAGVWR